MKQVFSFLKNSTDNNPERVYVIDKGREYSYSEIYKRTLSLAWQLAGHRIGSGDRVLIYLDNSVEYITAFFAVLLLNAIVVPVNKNTTLENIEFMIRDTSPRVILSNTSFLKRLRGQVGFEEFKLLNLDLIQLGGTRGNSLLDDLSTDSSVPAMILYTSGTTRNPKGVTLTHRNLIANTDSILDYLRLSCEDSVLATINFSYSYGNSVLLTHTKAGAGIVIENKVSFPIKVLEALEQSKATGFSTVGSYINLLLKQQSMNDKYFQHLRYITFAGESTSTTDLEKLNRLAPHIRLFVMYGQTEAAARLSYLEPEKLIEKVGSIGRGISGVTLRVISEDGSLVQPGEIGEIVAAGENIMQGYWNNAAETAEVIREGWLHTGDLATVDSDGYIYVKGRNDDIIKYLGHRISPLEIEAAINSCAGVLEAAVVAVTAKASVTDTETGTGWSAKDAGILCGGSPEGEVSKKFDATGIEEGFQAAPNNLEARSSLELGEEKRIKAYVIPSDNGCCIEDIHQHVRKLLPAFKRPHIIEFVDEIPRTTNGKIKRSELRQLNAN